MERLLLLLLLLLRLLVVRFIPGRVHRWVAQRLRQRTHNLCSAQLAGGRRSARGQHPGVLEPPPWLELTTREPSTNATRVSPPGSTHTSLPSLTANGRKST